VKYNSKQAAIATIKIKFSKFPTSRYRSNKNKQMQTDVKNPRLVLPNTSESVYKRAMNRNIKNIVSDKKLPGSKK